MLPKQFTIYIIVQTQYELRGASLSIKKIMSLIQERPDFQKLLINKIADYFKDKILDQTHTKDNTLKHIFKMVITDPQLEELFKYLIKTQVNKLKQAPVGIKYSPEEETRIIKESIKTYIEQIIKKELQLKLTNLKNHKYNLKNNKSHEMKRKIIKKQSLKCRLQSKSKKNEEIIQILSQSENQPQQTTLNTQAKNSPLLYKRTIENNYSSFLASKTKEGISQLQKSAQLGHFIVGDNVKAVLDIYYQGIQERDIVLLIEWRERRDGFKPQNSMVSLKDYQYYKPLQVRLLLKRIGRDI